MNKIEKSVNKMIAKTGTPNYPYICATSRNERQRLDRRVARGELVRPYRSIYVPSGWWIAQNPLTKQLCLAYACSEIHPSWIFCHETAAALWGLCPPYTRLGMIHVAVSETNHQHDTSHVKFHRFRTLTYTELGGVYLTTCERTAIDCMRTLPFLDGLATADAALHRGHWENLHLLHYAAQELNAPLSGISQAKIIALIADGRSESGGESVARGNMIRSGFALPELQTEVTSRVGGHRYRVDFSWPLEHTSSTNESPQVIFGELDGRAKYTDPLMTHSGTINTILDERRRESELTLESQAIVRFSYQEARSCSLLSKKLETFGVPRVCAPLVITGNSKHNKRELARYLEANAATNESAAERLAYLKDQEAGLPY